MRMLVYSPQDEYLFDIPYGEIYDGNIRERINGEHVMTLVTSHVLEKEQRVLWRDGMNKWREYVISGVDKAHANGGKPIGTYRGVWSLQHDLQVSQVSKMPGVQSAVSAETALTAALSETNRWNVGNVTVTTMGGTSMYDMQVWDALKALLSMWGGEIDARIEVGTNGVIGRYVDYFEQIGSQTVTRRFTYARDMHEIHRVVEDGVVACRIVPRGKGEASGDGYGRKIKIGDVNDGVDWLQNDAAAALYKLPDGEGDYEYPTVFVDNGDIEDKQVLLDWGREILNDYTTPNVTYKANVLQLEAAGMDSHGIALGDKVQCADRKFSDEGLIIEGRITELVTYFRDRRRHDVTIGHISEPIAVTLARESAGLKEQLSAMSKQVSETTYSLLHSLLDMINQQINATGGYTYLVEGEGTITYDIEVDDPLIGYNSSTQTWASQVTQMKGGTLRFANSKKPSFAGIGDWNWTNVITAEGYIALAATIARLNSGYIGSAASGNYWNLDTGEFRMAATSTMVGTQTLAEYIGDNLGLDQADVFNLLTNNGALQGLYMSGGNLYINASYIQSGTLKLGGLNNANGVLEIYDANNTLIGSWDNSGAYITGQIEMKKFIGRYNNYNRYIYALIGEFTDSFSTREASYSGTMYGFKVEWVSQSTLSSWEGVASVSILPHATRSDGANETMSAIAASDELIITTCSSYGSNASDKGGYLAFYDYETLLYGNTNKNTSNGRVRYSYIELEDDEIRFHLYDSSNYQYGNGMLRLDTSRWHAVIDGDTGINGDLSVYGTKNRVVETDNYSKRMLYCYETSSPMFGDIGSAKIGDDGICVVSIDDIFAECVRTDMSYQVFLQKCGSGDLWVSEKMPTCFTVEGTPNLSFDWEIKAHQIGYENERIDEMSQRDDFCTMGVLDEGPIGAYSSEFNYVEEIERLYNDGRE